MGSPLFTEKTVAGKVKRHCHITFQSGAEKEAHGAYLPRRLRYREAQGWKGLREWKRNQV